MKRLALVLGAGVLALAAQGCGGAAASRPDAPQPTAGRPIWIVSGADLSALRHSNAGLARRFFDNSNTYIVGDIDGVQLQVPPGYSSIPALSYPSATRFAQDARSEKITRGVQAVIYDPESWTQTPPSEQHDPVAAMATFTAQARRWGYSPVMAPGRDLVMAPGAPCAKRPGELVDDAYLRCRLTAGAAGADVFAIQAAADELDRPTLSRLLRRGGRQLQPHGPSVRVIATLSTNPPGSRGPIWPIDLLRAARLELSRTQGIVFNFTPKTTWLAASFLRDLERVQHTRGLNRPR